MPRQRQQKPQTRQRRHSPTKRPRSERAWSRFASNLVGSFSEAWLELRTHKLRVTLSLIGIAVAVAALTTVVALGELQKQLLFEQSESYSGRIATVRIDTQSKDGSAVDWNAVDKHFEAVNKRYGFTHTSRIIDNAIQVPIQLPEGVTMVPSRQYDPSYPLIFRTKLKEGRWFREDDAELLAPPVIVSEALWERLGSPPLTTHPILEMTDAYAGTYQIIGVLPKQWEGDQDLKVDLLYDTVVSQLGELPSGTFVSRVIWIQEDRVAEIGPVLAMDLRAGTPEGTEVSVSRSDSGMHSGFAESFLMMQVITSAIASIVLLLGGLSLVNIQLVAMRQRIREIGVRRSFGASGGRIFTSVMMESVVATAVAGVLGIILAVVLVRSPLIMQTMFYGLQDVPPFPFAAAIIGLLASILTGALAGLIPAIVAMRVRVIDAIRY